MIITLSHKYMVINYPAERLTFSFQYHGILDSHTKFFLSIFLTKSKYDHIMDDPSFSGSIEDVTIPNLFSPIHAVNVISKFLCMYRSMQKDLCKIL